MDMTRVKAGEVGCLHVSCEGAYPEAVEEKQESAFACFKHIFKKDSNWSRRVPGAHSGSKQALGGSDVS